MRRRFPRRWRSAGLIALAALALSTPAVAQVATAAAETTCSSMGTGPVQVVTLSVLLGSLIALVGMERRLRIEGWSLAHALSEPLLEKDGSHDPSSSRLIAMAGMLVILLLYLGFGVFTLYNFGMTCSVPASTSAVTGFLYSGLALFAPYIANKFSNVFRPLLGRPAPPASDGDSPAPGLRAAPSAARAAVASAAPAPDPVAVAPVHAAAEEAPTSVHAAGPGSAGASAPAPAATTPAPPPPRPAPPAPPAPPAVASTDAYAPAQSLIATFEGFVDHAYPDPASGGDPWTIGYGFTQLAGRPVKPGDRLSRADGDALLHSGVQACASHLAGTIPYWAEMHADQRCALISFAWNLGQNFYGDSDDFRTISRCLRDRAWNDVPAALLLYCNPGSSVEAGLRRRRQAEADLWRQGLAASPAATPPAAATAPVGATAPAAATAPAGAHPNPLPVPWYDQLAMDDGQGWRDCFSASSAMLAAFWRREPDENTYNHLRQRYGDSTSSEAQLDALRHLGLQAEFRTDGTIDALKREIDAGRPVAVGWLHHGPASDPSGGGHWTVVIGYDDSGVIMNDPYGSCDLVNGGYPRNHNGASQHYSYRNWLPRWQPQGSGGWYLCCWP